MTIKTSHHTKIISAILLVFILSGISFVSAFSSSLATETTTAPSPSFSIYFVSTNKSQLETEALSLANDVAKNNGAGYVWKNGNYFYVISSAYENKNDANLVSAEMTSKKIDNEVFEIEFPLKSIASPIDSPEAKNTFNAASNIFLSTYKTLFDISVSLDTHIYEETTARIELNHVQAKSNEILRNFNIVFEKESNDQIIMLNTSIQKLNDSLENLCQENDKNTTSLLSQIRYCYCKILAVYFDFLTKIN